jgi:D-sedoheptulose 7-phosphate isomerase
MKPLKFRKPKDHLWGNADGRHAQSFLINLEEIQKEFQASDHRGKALSLQAGMAEGIRTIVRTARRGGKLIFIGNGGSAAIASHQAVDFWKNGGIESLAFNDSSLLTCIGNDCGFENLFSVPLKRFAKAGDTVIAISSSGKSPNILNGAHVALAQKCSLITYSGFAAANPLRKMGAVNFYVPSSAYGLVEVSHLAIIHSMLRELIYLNPTAAKKGY